MIINWKISIKKLTQTKHVIVENEIKKLGTFDLIYFCGKSHFEDDDTQNYLVFQMAYRYFKTVSNNDAKILLWKSKGFSDENIKPPSTSKQMLNPSLDYVGTKARVAC